MGGEDIVRPEFPFLTHSEEEVGLQQYEKQPPPQKKKCGNEKKPSLLAASSSLSKFEFDCS